MIPLNQSTLYTLEQLIDLLNQINDVQYEASLPLLSGNTIGKHVRHIIECYQGLISGIESGVIDYENRARNLTLENESQKAIEVLKQIIIAFDKNEVDKSLFIETNQSLESEGVLLIKSSRKDCVPWFLNKMFILAFPKIASVSSDKVR